MSLDISKHSWYNYCNQGNRHPTTLKISFFPFLFFSFILSLLYSFLSFYLGGKNTYYETYILNKF